MAKTAKIKKSDLRYGDIIRFTEGPLAFGGGTNMLGERREAFTEDTFYVDVLKPKRGRVTPELELRPAAFPKSIYSPKGKFPAFEVIARLPDDVQVFKTASRNYGGMMHFRTMLIGRDGRTRDDKSVVANNALEAAREMGCAAIVFKSFGYAEVWPFPEGVPSLEFLQKNVEDPYDTITPAAHRLGSGYGPYLAYTGDNGLTVDDPIINETAQFALLGDPDLGELRERIHTPEGFVENPDYYECRYAGGVVLLVGFSICEETGETIRTPITKTEEVAA